jgi:hypothetical protein
LHPLPLLHPIIKCRTCSRYTRVSHSVGREPSADSTRAFRPPSTRGSTADGTYARAVFAARPPAARCWPCHATRSARAAAPSVSVKMTLAGERGVSHCSALRAAFGSSVRRNHCSQKGAGRTHLFSRTWPPPRDPCLSLGRPALAEEGRGGMARVSPPSRERTSSFPKPSSNAPGACAARQSRGGAAAGRRGH